MADSKITALTALTAADPANDMIPIVDVSDTPPASGNTKRISINNILACSPSATLASATITGDLTVDTNVLKVDTSNNRVGINNASPAQALDVAGSVYLSTNATYIYGKTSGGSATRAFGINAANDVYIGSIDQSISNIRFNSGGGDLAILNSTGLGVGVASPSYKLDVNGVARVNSGGDGLFLSAASSPDLYIVGTNYYNNNGTEGVQVSARPSWKIEHKNTSDALAYLDIGFRAASAAASAFTSRFKIDGSGNVGIGVTPSAGKGCLQLSSGINFPATQVASSDANTLDDYKESTWTPTITAGTGTPTTVTVNAANYTKIGRVVVVNIDFSVVAIGTAAGSLTFTLPFSHSGSSIPCGAFRENVSTGNMGQIYYGSATTASCLMYNNATPWVNGYRIQGTYTYFSA